MTIEILESSAGSNFAFTRGQTVSLSDFSDKDAGLEILKEQVRSGHAIEISGAKSERATAKTAVEKR